MLRGLLLVVAVAAGCYRVPSDAPCTIRCDFANNQACPGNLTCGADNLCNAGVQCDQLPDAGTIDATEIDAPIAIDGPNCHMTPLYTFCPTTVQPVYEVTSIQSANISTDDPGNDCTDIFLGVGNVEICVIAAVSISIRGPLRVSGRRPFMLYAQSGISIQGMGRIDVSAGGPGTSTTTCASNAGKNQDAAGGSAGGGAGGSFRGSGGVGGSPHLGGGATPGAADGVLQSVHAGCHGGRGGASHVMTGAGAGGLAGGAIVLATPGSISVDGTINASGGGGGGTPSVVNRSSGGGGGSGGLILLDGSTVIATKGSLMLAQGGGGGAGSNPNFVGTAGGVPSVGVPAMRAPGGLTDGPSGDGGAGSGMNDLAGVAGGNAPQGSTSGGGGGGGAGMIYVLNGTRMFDVDAGFFPNVLP